MERDIVKRIEDLMDLFVEGEVKTADQIQRPEDPYRDFNERNPLAGGGMLVQPSADGSRPGYKEDKKFRVYDSPDVDKFSDALLDAYAKDDITKIVESGKSTKFSNVISAIESGKDKSAKLRKVIQNTGLDEETIFNLLDDRKAYIDLAREGGPSGASPRAGNFYKKAENWITKNAARYADPEKFKKAFIRTFGKNNDLSKTLKRLDVPGGRKKTSVPFSEWFKESILGTQKGSGAGYNYNQLNNIFKTAIYTNNPNVRKNITKEIERILSIPGGRGGKFDIRDEIKNSPLFKKFGLDKQIRGPIARLIANEVGQELLDQISSFRDPYLGTSELIRFLKDKVDPKYKSMFVEASRAVDLAAKQKWPEAKNALKIKDDIMFDHKIPKQLISLGYADEIEYIKLNPTSKEFNVRIKNPKFDQPMIKLAKDFSNAKTMDAKANIVAKMNKLKNDFSKQYGGYLDEVSINVDKTGKPIFKSSAAPVTKKTDFVSSLSKSLTQAGEITKKQEAQFLRKMGFKCKFAASKGGLGRCDDPANYVEDINKTRQNLKSTDVRVRAAANAKLNKGLQIAKTLPQIGTFLRRVGQATVGGVAKALQATGIGSPVGIAIEGMVEGGIYDYFKGQGYTDQQALSETFFPGMISGRPEGVPWYGGAEQLLEKELTKGQPRVAQYVDALKDQEQVFDAFGRKEQGLQARRKDITDIASADIQDLNRSGTISRINRIMNPESMASRAYQTAVEKQAGRQDQRARDYKDRFYVQREPSEFMQNQLQKERNKAMLEMFPPPTVEGVQNLFEAYGVEDRLKDFEAQDYKNVMSVLDDLQKQDYFADNFRLEKAGGGIAGLSGGIDKGPQRRSMNPDSQGLSGLLKRGMKT